ncbi:hypothetical protein BC941DRAFT_412431 [Chlamydoabsidia padenii]|nr:hypothetical protein BC941DRAFT_412431 [Chlamydoabsidia padenii]
MDFKILSKYDDLCATLFLDDQYLWFDTIKMNDEQVRADTPYQVIQQIIYDYVVVRRQVTHAAKELLNLPFFQVYLEGKDDKERMEFMAHVKRYLLMYIPNAGFEISDTDRYTGIEACVISTRTWEIADEIKNCTGMIACLTPEDDAELKRSNRDFSIMYSQRRDSNCLFLGPARFMNHDCGANCRFIGLGPNGITFKVVKKIEIGEELTVFYGPHYFGIDNCECRCVTCELNGRGYFASSVPKVEDPPPEITTNETTRRSGRKKRSRLYEEYVVHNGDRRVKLWTENTSPKKSRKGELKHQQQQKTMDNLSLPPSPSNDLGLVSKTTSISTGSPQSTFNSSTATSVTSESFTSLRSSACADISNGGYSDLKKKDAINLLATKPDDMPLYTAMDNLLITADSQQTIYDNDVLTKRNMDDTLPLSDNEEKSTLAPKEAIMDELNDPPEWLQIMDSFLDDISDVSSIASDDLAKIEDTISDHCIACDRPLSSATIQRYTRSNNPGSIRQYEQLRHQAQTRCWRCSRHYLIYHLEWPVRWDKRLSCNK